MKLLKKLFSSRRKNFYIVRCPDGTVRQVYRNVDDLIPLVFKIENADVALGFQTDAGGSAGIKATYAAHVDYIRSGLNERRIKMIDAYRLAYGVYAADPCGRLDFLERKTEGLLADQSRDENARLKFIAFMEFLHSDSSSDKAAQKMFQDLINGMDGNAGSLGAHVAIEEAQQRAIEWKTDDENGR